MAIPITPSDDRNRDIQVLDDVIRVVTYDQPRQLKHIGSHRVEVLIANFSQHCMWATPCVQVDLAILGRRLLGAVKIIA